MSSIWTNGGLSISVFGESHGAAIGAVLDGLPSGEEVDLGKLSALMMRRAPGRSALSTPRSEADAVEILSGLYNGKTTGTPLALVIRNTDTQSGDYADLVDKPRPSHADYTGRIRYKGANDPRGGGHFSGRLTAPLTAAGGICLQILARKGIQIASHLYSVGSVQDQPFARPSDFAAILQNLNEWALPVINPVTVPQMRQEIEGARRTLDSVGGIIECAAIGLPAGIGSPMFGGIENILSSLLFGIPALRGIDFGIGFEGTKLFGSSYNDPFTVENGKVVTKTNHAGGVNGGITNGMPLVFRAAFRPTPSISTPQQTVNLTTMQEETLVIKGRHDPCILPRASAVVEAAAAIALLSLLGKD